MKKIEMKRGVYILPSLFTVSNLFFGFASLVYAQKDEYRIAAAAIFVAAFLDMLDGRIARLTGTESDFGAQLDSIVDVVSFGVAPAFLVFHWGFTDPEILSNPLLARLGWAAAFLFVTCGALRLARFNVQKHVVDSRYFVGLPIPMGAALLGATVLRFPDRLDVPFASYLVFTLTVFAALMMVSRVRYRSFKDANLKSRAPYTVAVVIAIMLIGFLVSPSSVLFVGLFLYLFHPFLTKVINNGFRNGSEALQATVLDEEEEGTSDEEEEPAQN